ncbi:MAG: hypothetical protein ABI740_00815 [Alphaproteobacteria bacterium]
MPLTMIILRRIRNPDEPYGDRSQGLILTAPIDSQGRLDAAEWAENPSSCTVVRFRSGATQEPEGLLTQVEGHWKICYGGMGEGGDAPVYWLDDHRLAVGDYLTLHESSGGDCTYRVDQHMAVRRDRGLNAGLLRPTA